MLLDWPIAILVGASAMAVYVRTACRTVYVGDSGELAAAVHTLGVPHPPGYPLYVLLGKSFCLMLPIGRPIFRLNLFSGVCSSLSVACLYGSFVTLEFSPLVAASLALAWGLSASLWSQSGIARVYSLGALISSLATLLALQWYTADPPGHSGWLLAATFVVGMGLANHPVVGAHLPALVALVVFRQPNLLIDPWHWAQALLCLVPGCCLYLFIPLRAKANPAVNWDNISTWPELKRYLTRKSYWKVRYVRSFADLFEVLWFYIRRVGIEYGFLGATGIVIGILLLTVFHPAILAMVAVLVLLNVAAMVAHARREDIFHWTRYMITTWFALALPLAYGWNSMLTALALALPERLAMGATFLLPFLLPLVMLIAQFRSQDLSRHRYAEEYNRRILDCLPQGATLIAQDDNVVFPLMYLKHVEGVRPDVLLLEQGVHQLKPLTFNPRKEAVYCTHWQQAFNQPPSPKGPGLMLVAEGVIYRIISTDTVYQPRDLWQEFEIPDMEDPAIPRNYLTRCLLAHVYFMRGESLVRHEAGEAVGWYDRAFRMAADSPTLNYNLGLTYRRLGFRITADDAFERACKLDRSLQHPGRPERL